MLTILIQPN